MKLDRRSLLIGGGAGVGLIVAVALWPRHWKSELPVAQGEEAFGSFIKIARDGKITVAVPQVETGQGIWTALPQIVADELGAAWETVAIEPAPLAKVYANSLAEEEGWPASIRITANSTSVRAFEQPLREAAATARTMLIGAAADRWNVDPSTCDTADGFVISGSRLGSVHEVVQQANKGSAIMSFPQPRDSSEPVGSRDGYGAGDHDQPYRFGRRRCAATPCPPRPAQRGFNTRQYSRILVLRGRVREDLAARARRG